MFRKLTMMTVILLIFSYFAARGDEAAATDTLYAMVRYSYHCSERDGFVRVFTGRRVSAAF